MFVSAIMLIINVISCNIVPCLMVFQWVWQMPQPVPCSRPCWQCVTENGPNSANSSWNASWHICRAAAPPQEWGQSPSFSVVMSDICIRATLQRAHDIFLISVPQSASGVPQGPGLQSPHWHHHTAGSQVSPPWPLQESPQGSAGRLGPPSHCQLPHSEANCSVSQVQTGGFCCPLLASGCRSGLLSVTFSLSLTLWSSWSCLMSCSRVWRPSWQQVTWEWLSNWRRAARKVRRSRRIWCSACSV